MSFQPMRVAGVSLVCWTVGVSATVAQSLADVAKKEGERRGTVAAPGKVYTNSSLVPDFTKPAVTPPPTPAAPTKEAAPPAAATAGSAEEPLQVPIAAPGTEVEVQGSSDKGEDYWRTKAAMYRTAIAAQRAQVAALESRSKNLAASKIAGDRREGELTSAMLEKARADMASIEQERDNFEAVAKSRNVPGAWLR